MIKKLIGQNGSKIFQLYFFIALLLPMDAFSQNSFKLIVLGSGGGIDESNLSAYLLARANTDRYILLDGGTLMHGLELASQKGYFNHLQKESNKEELAAMVLHHHIDSYIISHPHLDHIMGIMMAAPFDNHKSIICSKSTADELMNHVFESGIWANFTTEGKSPVGKWDIIRIPEESWHTIPNSSLEIKSYTLCHSCPNKSTAFLIKNDDTYVLYFGDTGADEIEGQKRIEHIFQDITHLVQNKKLKALFIEVSFPNQHNNKHLYGHLKPELLYQELAKLAHLVNSNNPNIALEGLEIFITHIKPNYSSTNNSRAQIIKELEMMNHFGAHFIYPKQTEKFEF